MRRVTALSSCVAVTRVDPAEAGVKLTRPKQVSGEGGVTCDFRRM
jgi:hypothetical protein